jgi:hypothetical protein
MSYKVPRVLGLGTPAAHPAIGQAAKHAVSRPSRRTRAWKCPSKRSRSGSYGTLADFAASVPRGAERCVPPSRTSFGCRHIHHLNGLQPREKLSVFEQVGVETGGLTEVAVYVAKRDHRRWPDGRAREKQRELVHEVPGSLGCDHSASDEFAGEAIHAPTQVRPQRTQVFRFRWRGNDVPDGRGRNPPINLTFMRGT